MGRCPKPHLSPFWKKGLKIPKTFDKRKTPFFSGISKVLDKWSFSLKSSRLSSGALPKKTLIFLAKRKCISGKSHILPPSRSVFSQKLLFPCQAEMYFRKISYSPAKQKHISAKIYNPPAENNVFGYSSFPLSFQERGGVRGGAPRVLYSMGRCPIPHLSPFWKKGLKIPKTFDKG